MSRRKKTEEPAVEQVVEKTEEPAVEQVVVADGKSICCKRGILPAGTPVFAKDFPGGESSIEEHISNGGLVRQ